MDVLGAAFGLLGTVLQLVEESKTASKEQHDAIVARLVKTNADLQDALTAARAARASEAAATQEAIDKARQS